jgi:hypothetical protein
LANGQITLSSGNPTQIPIGQVLEVRSEPSFNGERYFGHSFVVLRLADREIGLMMNSADEQSWLAALGKRS